jgi:hypothetical protein
MRDKKKPRPNTDLIVVGAALGAALGIEFDNIGLGIAIGVVLGAAMTMLGGRKDD